jgi:5-methylcytosine-specific restriction endonuclease McrA
LEVHGRLAAEDGALLLRALEAQRDVAWREGGGSAEPRPARQAAKAEALVAVCEASLAHGGQGRTGAERYQVVVYADEHALADEDGDCELADGSPLAAETARRLACDASLVRAGRRSRTIPPALRRALRRRDRGCRFPGCENRLFLDAHHRKHWAQGGETTLDNLLLLCRRHHRLVHEGGYTVDRQGRFYSPWGAEIERVPRLPRGDPDQLIDANNAALDEHSYRLSGGERFDLDYAVLAMTTIARHAAKSRGDPG